MTPELESNAVVLVGDFDPAALLPTWFLKNELVAETDVDDMAIEIVLPNINRFRIGWLNVSAERNKLQLSTTNATRFRPLMDLAYEVLRLLPDTGIRAIGLNGEAHFKIDSEEDWHLIGHTLAPKRVWDSILDKPGMLSLTIQGYRDDDSDGYVNVKVEPSVRFPGGVFVAVNDHFQFAKDDTAVDSATAIRALDKSFEASAVRRQSYYEAVFSAGSGS